VRAHALLLLCGALAGCAVGPDYTRPAAPSEAAWSAPLAPGVDTRTPDAEALARFWMRLDDPLLSSLVERALAGSPSLHEALARLREARARRMVARAGLLPQLDAFGSTSRSHAGGEAGGSFSGVPTGGGGDRSLYQAGLDASWELDLFGGRRRELEAATAHLEASEEDVRDVRVSLTSELALAYVELRALQARTALAQANVDTQTETFEIAGWRAEAGLTNALDVDQARAELGETRAAVPLLESALAAARHRVAVLCGEPPDALLAELEPVRPTPVAPLELAVGVPADTLLRRPDVRRAERELAAQTARVGVATAARYPSVALVGSIGLEALSRSELFASGAGTSAFRSSLSQVIFDFGRLKAQVDAEDALREQALERFRATVLAALEEVENALVAYANEQERRTALVDAAAAAERAAALSRDLYASGLVDFENVLVAQRSVFTLQDALATSEAEVTSNLVRLYKALGGGWSPGGPG
jgi:NodT family efflux transporter outer membrane factor (OMF) lipoprotein